MTSENAAPIAPIMLDAIRARADAATAGPWAGHEDGLVWPSRMGDPVGSVNLPEDAEFIAHAREDVPALLAEIERQRDMAQANERARIVASLRAEFSRHSDGWEIAEMIERGEI